MPPSSIIKSTAAAISHSHTHTHTHTKHSARQLRGPDGLPLNCGEEFDVDDEPDNDPGIIEGMSDEEEQDDIDDVESTPVDADIQPQPLTLAATSSSLVGVDPNLKTLISQHLQQRRHSTGAQFGRRRSSYISPPTSSSIIFVNRRTSVVTVIRKISFDGVSLDPDGDEAKKKKEAKEKAAAEKLAAEQAKRAALLAAEREAQLAGEKAWNEHETVTPLMRAPSEPLHNTVPTVLPRAPSAPTRFHLDDSFMPITTTNLHPLHTSTSTTSLTPETWLAQSYHDAEVAIAAEEAAMAVPATIPSTSTTTTAATTTTTTTTDTSDVLSAFHAAVATSEALSHNDIQIDMTNTSDVESTSQSTITDAASTDVTSTTSDVAPTTLDVTITIPEDAPMIERIPTDGIVTETNDTEWDTQVSNITSLSPSAAPSVPISMCTSPEPDTMISDIDDTIASLTHATNNTPGALRRQSLTRTTVQDIPSLSRTSSLSRAAICTTQVQEAMAAISMDDMPATSSSEAESVSHQETSIQPTSSSVAPLNITDISMDMTGEIKGEISTRSTPEIAKPKKMIKKSIGSRSQSSTLRIKKPPVDTGLRASREQQTQKQNAVDDAMMAIINAKSDTIQGESKSVLLFRYLTQRQTSIPTVATVTVPDEDQALVERVIQHGVQQKLKNKEMIQDKMIRKDSKDMNIRKENIKESSPIMIRKDSSSKKRMERMESTELDATIKRVSRKSQELEKTIRQDELAATIRTESKPRPSTSPARMRQRSPSPTRTRAISPTRPSVFSSHSVRTSVGPGPAAYTIPSQIGTGPAVKILLPLPQNVSSASPGPAYGLPSTIGTAPAHSIALPLQQSVSDTPGVGAYTIPSTLGGENAPAHSIGLPLPISNETEGPGVGAYDIPSTLGGENAPAHSIALPLPVSHQTDAPGVGTYTIPSTIGGDNAPSHSIALPRPITHETPGPGPAFYDSKSMIGGDNAPSHTIALPRPVSHETDLPGVGTYDIPSTIGGDNAPAHSIGLPRPISHETEGPGPAFYDQKSMIGVDAPSHSIGFPRPISNETEGPGPAAYTIPSTIGNDAPSHSIGLPIPISVETVSPGPAAYNIPSMIGGENAPMISIGLPHPISTPSEGPGPAAYNIPSTIGGDNAPAMTIGLPHVSTISSDTPSPTTYHIPSTIGTGRAISILLPTTDYLYRSMYAEAMSSSPTTTFSPKTRGQLRALAIGAQHSPVHTQKEIVTPLPTTSSSSSPIASAPRPRSASLTAGASAALLALSQSGLTVASPSRRVSAQDLPSAAVTVGLLGGMSPTRGLASPTRGLWTAAAQ